MKIAFDAKRIYQNRTGLGNYSRTLVDSLCTNFPDNEYYLYAPKVTSLFNESLYKNLQTKTPTAFPEKYFKSLWRSSWVKKDLIKDNIDIFHGLSHEIPFGIEHTNIKSVATIHDLIFERYPEQYNSIDISIYRRKFKNACKNSNVIIAISEQTKNDIIEFYNIEESKIKVCYQSCDTSFYKEVSSDDKNAIQLKYNLPEKYFLYVGSVIERKNLLGICKAIQINSDKSLPPLVVIGSGKKYLQTVKDFVEKNNLEKKIIFLSEEMNNGKPIPFIDFPAIYQSATAMIYPSIFEGFGIPILESLASKLPVITSNISCMPEVGGDAAIYVNPFNPEEIAHAMATVISNDNELLIKKGIEQAAKFTNEHCANAVMDVYKNVRNDD